VDISKKHLLIAGLAGSLIACSANVCQAMQQTNFVEDFKDQAFELDFQSAAQEDLKMAITECKENLTQENLNSLAQIARFFQTDRNREGLNIFFKKLGQYQKLVQCQQSQTSGALIKYAKTLSIDVQDIKKIREYQQSQISGAFIECVETLNSIDFECSVLARGLEELLMNIDSGLYLLHHDYYPNTFVASPLLSPDQVYKR
jgi:hypothetical protein